MNHNNTSIEFKWDKTNMKWEVDRYMVQDSR